VEKYFDGAPLGIISASATKIYLPHETYVAPDVDHGSACTWHWNYVKYPETVCRCVGSSQ
jgi:hypothetical protein